MTFKLTRNVYKSLADDCTCCDYTFEIWMHNFIISFSPEMHSFYICCFLPKKKKKARLMFQVWLIFRAKMIRHFCTAVHPHESLYNLTSSQDTRTQLFFQWGIHIWKEQFWEAQHKRKIISLFSSATLPRPIPTFTQTY